MRNNMESNFQFGCSKSLCHKHFLTERLWNLPSRLCVTHKKQRSWRGWRINDVEADEHVLYKIFLNKVSGGCIQVVSGSEEGFLCMCLFLLVKVLIRVQVEQMTDLCCEMERSTGFNLPSVKPQSSRIQRAQLNMPLKGIHPSGWSCCCLMTASAEFSLAWLHTCACITPVLVWFF